MSKKLSIVLLIISGMFLMVSSQLFGQQENIINSEEKKWQALDDNYTLILTIEMPQIKRSISFIVANANFKFTQHFPNALINLEGELGVKSNDLLSLGYKLEVRENIGEKGDSEWIDNGCQGGVLLQENQKLTIFKTEGRSYAISITKITNKE